MKVFLDVGAHLGESIPPSLDPIYNFDKIISFEPVRKCYQSIMKEYGNNSKIIVCNYGLSDKNGNIEIYQPGSEGASIYKDHIAHQPNKMRDYSYADSELCNFRSAADFFKNEIFDTDVVIMKLNCEGSECDIIQDLFDNKQLYKISNLLIDFDALKIPSQRHKVENIRNILKNSGVKYYEPVEVQYGAGSHFGGIKQWFNKTGVREANRVNLLKSFFYHLQMIIENKHSYYYKLKVLQALPKSLVDFYYKRIKL